MNQQALATELSNDPESRGYSGMSDEAAAVDLNTAYRTRDKATMAAHEVAQSIDVSEFNGKTTTQQRLIWDVLHMGTINPFGIEATLFISVFGASSATIDALKVARKVAITRAQELGLGVVKPGYVAKARA